MPDSALAFSFGQNDFVRILTWNLQGRVGEWEHRHHAIQTVLKEHTPDVALFQESWVEPDGSTQAALFAEQLGLHCSTAAELAGFTTYPQATYWVVNAIITRWPNRIVRAQALVDENGAPTWRHMLAVVVERPQEDGGSFLAVGTHLEHGIDRSPTRSAQLQHLVTETAALLGGTETWRQSLPAIIAGDFNAVPWSEEIRRATGAATPFVEGFVLIDAWEACGNTDRGDTWATANELVPRRAVFPNRRLDYVTTTAPRMRNRGSFDSCTLAGVEPINGVQPSDHYAVVAEVDL